MFLVLKWPTGWDAGDLLALAGWVTPVSICTVLLPAIVTASTRRLRTITVVCTLAAGVAGVFGISRGWIEPMSLDPDPGQTSALPSAIALAWCVVAITGVVLLLHSARRAGSVTWTVTAPRDQGGAVAGYLATYLLPLLASGSGGWRMTAAYAIYMATLYVVYIRSDALVLINPTLYLFRYRIYDVQVEAEEAKYRRRVLLLTTMQIVDEAEVVVRPLGDQNYVAKPAL